MSAQQYSAVAHSADSLLNASDSESFFFALSIANVAFLVLDCSLHHALVAHEVFSYFYIRETIVAHYVGNIFGVAAVRLKKETTPLGKHLCSLDGYFTVKEQRVCVRDEQCCFRFMLKYVDLHFITLAVADIWWIAHYYPV
jgi:hypothetical protein